MKYLHKWEELIEEHGFDQEHYPPPPHPRHFLYDPDIPFIIDDYRNVEHVPVGQVLFHGDRTTLSGKGD